MDKRAELRDKALKDLQQSGVLMLDGHFDYGNGYHGRVYLNPHQLFRHPSTIWRFAQDLIDLLPAEVVRATAVVAGPVTGGALLAHTIAGLLDSRRSLTHPPCSFAPFNYDLSGGFALRPFYRDELRGKRVLLADDIRNTGETFARCAALGFTRFNAMLGESHALVHRDWIAAQEMTAWLLALPHEANSGDVYAALPAGYAG